MFIGGMLANDSSRQLLLQENIDPAVEDGWDIYYCS